MPTPVPSPHCSSAVQVFPAPEGSFSVQVPSTSAPPSGLPPSAAPPPVPPPPAPPSAPPGWQALVGGLVRSHQPLDAHWMVALSQKHEQRSLVPHVLGVHWTTELSTELPAPSQEKWVSTSERQVTETGVPILVGPQVPSALWSCFRLAAHE